MIINNSRFKSRKLTAGKSLQNIRKIGKSNVSRNYSLMLQIYVISREEKLQKQKLKPVLEMAKNRKSSRVLTSIKSNLLTSMVRPMFQKLHFVKTRVYSAIEISYQSLIG